jgi:hypothetical protein
MVLFLSLDLVLSIKKYNTKPIFSPELLKHIDTTPEDLLG